MSNRKVPCGGFGLDENFLGMNENGELSLVSGASEDKAYKQLVTDGTGTAKWEDRLAYEYVAETAVLEEQSVSFTPQGGHMKATITGFFEFVAGSTVIVSWDGVLYPCTAQEIDSTTVVFGNFYLGGLTQDDTGEPFCIFAGQTNMALYPSDTSPNHDVSIFSDRKKAKIIDPKYTGLLAFSILWDGTSNYSATASYQEVRDAYDAKIPIFANLFVSDGCYPATEIAERDGSFVFHCGTYSVTYSSDGTIGEAGVS